jgi:hypothetical protein
LNTDLTFRKRNAVEVTMEKRLTWRRVSPKHALENNFGFSRFEEASEQYLMGL